MSENRIFNTLKCEFGYFNSTLYRWYKEGLPTKESIKNFKRKGSRIAGWGPVNLVDFYIEDKDIANFFNFDLKSAAVPLSFAPFKKEKTIEENSKYRIFKDKYGIIQKENKKSISMPQFLDYPVKNRGDFEKIKSLYTEDYEERLYNNWIDIVKNYRKEGYKIWLWNDLWGFFGILRQLMGIEILSLMFYDDPEFIKDILEFYTNYTINFWGYILDRVKVDIILIWEDMAYRQTSLISPRTFKEFLLPHYKELTHFLRLYKIKNIFVDSDGNIYSLIPLWIEGGVTGIYPMEVQAGMDIVKVRKDFPDLIIAGGIDKKAIAKSKEEIDHELDKAEYVLKTAKYVPFVDHSVPSDVPWLNFKYYRERLNSLIDKYN